jgi:hypothetical protein
VPPGFQVERLFVVPKDELGSWVCITSDPKGRLIASDQGDKGLVRITPAPLDGSQPTVIEKIPVPLTAAQGLLWAFDSLYVVCNGGPGSGLYRVTDSDKDDTLDKVEKLRVFDGSGECRVIGEPKVIAEPHDRVSHEHPLVDESQPPCSRLATQRSSRRRHRLKGRNE